LKIIPTLLMAWASLDGAYMQADFIGVTDDQMRAMEAKHGDKIVPLTDESVPKRLRQTTWTLITTEGAREMTAKGVVFRRGAGENHSLVVLGGDKAPTKQAKIREGLAVAKKLTHAPKLRPVSKGTRDKAALKQVNSAWVKSRPTNVPPKMSKFVPKRLAGSQVTVVEGTFRGSDRRYVYVSIPMTRKGASPGDYGYVTAFGVLEGGSLTWLKKPAHGLATLEPRFLVDVDGDGKDELVYDDFYYEGTYTSIMVETPEGRKNISLGGDGA